MKAFIAAVLIGALAGAIPLLIGTSYAAIWLWSKGNDGLLFPLIILMLPFIFALPIVLVSCIVSGIPLTAMLKRRGWESGPVYAVVGAFLGFVVLGFVDKA